MTALAISHVELTYFDGRGLAETSRLLLTVAGVPFQDTRYPLKVLDWSTHTFERKEFDLAKNSGKLKKSIGKVPFLRVGETVISQSKAIERYISRKYDMMGSNEEEAALIDAFAEHARDIKQLYQTPRKLEGDAKDAALAKFFNTTLPDRLIAIEESLDNSGTFLIGSKISLADITLFSLSEFFDNKEGFTGAIEKTPILANKLKVIETLPSVKTWVATRPVTSF